MIAWAAIRALAGGCELGGDGLHQRFDAEDVDQPHARNSPADPVVGAFPDGQSCLNLAAARLRYIVGTAWSTKCYMNTQLMQTEAVADQMCEEFRTLPSALEVLVQQAFTGQVPKAGVSRWLHGTHFDGVVRQIRTSFVSFVVVEPALGQ